VAVRPMAGSSEISILDIELLASPCPFPAPLRRGPDPKCLVRQLGANREGTPLERRQSDGE